MHKRAFARSLESRVSVSYSFLALLDVNLLLLTLNVTGVHIPSASSQAREPDVEFRDLAPQRDLEAVVSPAHGCELSQLETLLLPTYLMAFYFYL